MAIPHGLMVATSWVPGLDGPLNPVRYKSGHEAWGQVAVDCQAIEDLGETAEEKMEDCDEALSQATSIEIKAEALAAQADEAGSLCLVLPSPAQDACLIAAGIAREAAQAVAEEAHDAALRVAEGYSEANAAKMAIDGLVGHSIAGKGVQADCGEETADLTDAEKELDEFLAMADDADAPDFG
jgi:hypothetical protein